MTQDFSLGKMEKVLMATMPKEDLPIFDQGIVDHHEDSEHVVMFLEHNSVENWYWQYGQERLYSSFERLSPAEGVSWEDLHQFVSTYAWVEGKWRFILSKPCWMLHMDVVDRVVMLYDARRNYEEARAKADPRAHMDFLSLLDRIAADVQELLAQCEVKEYVNDEQTHAYVHHDGGEYVHNWIPSLLHRVITWETLTPPSSPVLVTTRQGASKEVEEQEGADGCEMT
jgi:hypothetical protein